MNPALYLAFIKYIKPQKWKPMPKKLKKTFQTNIPPNVEFNLLMTLYPQIMFLQKLNIYFF